MKRGCGIRKLCKDGSVDGGEGPVAGAGVLQADETAAVADKPVEPIPLAMMESR